MSDARPIGVFDSGIGGLTVVKALRELLPNENIFYLGDTARVPYGRRVRDSRTLRVQTDGHVRAKDAKALVVACNTVSAVALPKLRETFPFQ